MKPFLFAFFRPIGSFRMDVFSDTVALSVFSLSGILLAIVSYRLNTARSEQIRKEVLQRAYDDLESPRTAAGL